MIGLLPASAIYSVQTVQKKNRLSIFSACISSCVILALVACTPRLPYRARGKVVRAHPHAREAFTQGLVFDGSTLYESTGLYGESTLRQVDLETGKVLQMRQLPAEYFAEGCTVWGSHIIQLTWNAGVALVYDKESFAIQRQFNYSGEGWGLTHDGQRLIMSDGTSYLRFLDPDTFQETGRIQVLDRGSPVERLNELEWVRGEVWANVWQTPQIARIDADTGKVLGWIDFSELVEEEPRGVLNGIAMRGRTIFVTGKRWEAVYQVEIEPASSN
jgi:glutamine cyclotransferase